MSGSTEQIKPRDPRRDRYSANGRDRSEWSGFPKQRDLDIIVMYTIDKMSQRAIGEAVGLKQNQICRILKFWVPDDTMHGGAPRPRRWAKPEQGDGR